MLASPIMLPFGDVSGVNCIFLAIERAGEWIEESKADVDVYAECFADEPSLKRTDGGADDAHDEEEFDALSDNGGVDNHDGECRDSALDAWGDDEYTEPGLALELGLRFRARWTASKVSILGASGLIVRVICTPKNFGSLISGSPAPLVLYSPTSHTHTCRR